MDRKVLLFFVILPLFPALIAFLFSNYVFISEEVNFDSLLMESFKNMRPHWSVFGNSESAEPMQWHQPGSVKEIISIVRQAAEKGEKAKVVGAGHSFSPIGLTTGRIINLDRFRAVLDVDEESMQVTVQSGIRLRDLNRQLGTRGLALENIGSIDAQSLGGAISTSTHGSGVTFASMSNKVVWMELVLANGSQLNITRENEDLYAASLNGLGVLGIITIVRLQCVQDFNIHRQEILVPLDHVINKWSEYITQYDHFTFIWIPYTNSARLFLMTRVDTSVPLNKSDVFALQSYAGITLGKLLMFGWWLGSLMPSFLPWITNYYIQPLSSIELNYVDDAREGLKLEPPDRYNEMEYFIPLENYTECFKSLRQLIEASDEFKVSHIVQTRFSAADSVWLSPMYGSTQAGIALLLTRQDYQPYFNSAEKIFQNYGGRTHWAKKYSARRNYFREVYEKFDDFLAIRNELDPNRMFMNDFMEDILS